MSTSLNLKTYNEMKKEIMTLVLKPGEVVSAAKMAERYQVSRTPTREAIVKLESEGLVEIIPKSKSVVSKININRAKQEWFIRRTLEMGMVDALFERVSSSDIMRMRDLGDKMSEIAKGIRTSEAAYEYLNCDNEFHALTYNIAGQYLAAEVIQNTMTHYNRIRLMIDLDNLYKDRTVMAHEKLIELLEKKDKEGYRQNLSIHLGYITQDIEDMRAKNPELFE